MTREELQYEYWFASLRKVNHSMKRTLREQVHAAKELYEMEPGKWEEFGVKQEGIAEILQSKGTWNLEKQYEQLEQMNVKLIPYYHEEYPRELQVLASLPYALFRKGKAPGKDTLKVAIVGARTCSPYGERMALEFAEALASQHVEIISGMARGIDGAGHRGALNVGGSTCGILGCGVDVCYPREHIGLYVDLQERGCLLSEYPIGTPPLAQHFPARNRIISALADVVLVMEAREKSGSLITADFALELGKDVYALPGPVNSSLSQGCNRLIKQGAGILLSPEDLVEELHICGNRSVKKKLKNQIVLEREENMVYSCLGFYPKSIEQILIETSMEISELMNQLVSLEVKGYAWEISKNYYVKGK